MHIDHFDYQLPAEAIAQHPAERRDQARLLVDQPDGPVHRLVRDLPTLVGQGDVLVINTSRVRPVRLHLHKPTGGAVEVLLLEPVGDRWAALVKPSRRVGDGTVLQLAADDSEIRVVVGESRGDGTRLVAIEAESGLDQALAHHGEMPLPPYISEPLAEPGRYQTVYADQPGSAAAPTAGLHFTPALLDACREAGAEIVGVDLKVGLDTFRPVQVDDLDDHQMHSEAYTVPPATWEACQQAQRVIAIGTTTVRTLESAAHSGALHGRTDIFIQPGFEFRMVDALLTNFHLPRSTLLVMIESFIGPRWRELYAEALAEGYRFLSFGDAMFLTRRSDAA
ncbi:MAG: tRNA preQ1(34) S-adenosylmethionine ribosyltransferase-isomerase QueA [Acidimicrobiales bacterium]